MLPFDCLPLEVNKKIVSYAGIENLIQLLVPKDPHILDENSKLRKCVNQVIELSTIQYNDRIWNPEQFEDYFDHETFYDKRKLQYLKTPEDFLTLYAYCLEQKIPVILGLAYLIESPEDIGLLKQIAVHLKPDENVKLNLEFEKSEEGEIEHVFEYFFHVESVIGLHLGQEISHVNRIDYYFPELKCAHIERFLAEVFEDLKSTKLENLFVIGRRKSDETLDLGQLPCTLKFLYTQNISLTMDTRGSGSLLSPRLECIYSYGIAVEENAVTKVSEFIKRQLETTVKMFEWEAKGSFQAQDSTEVVSHTIMDVTSSPLTTLSISRQSPSRHLDWSSFEHLKSLTIMDLDDDSLQIVWLFPLRLEKLVICMCRLTDFTSIEDVLPLGLKRLEIGNIEWRVNLPVVDLLRLESLTYLELLSMTTGENIEQFVFPDSVEILHLTENPAFSFDQLLFPKFLHSLNISSSMLTSVDNVSFPESLLLLDIACNKLRSVTMVKFPQKLEKLDLEYNELKHFCKIKLPQTIKVINLRGNKLEKVDLSTNDKGEPLHLEKLKLQYNSTLTMDNLRLPSIVKCLRLSGCGLENLNGFQFPATIEELDLSENHLKQFNITFPKDSCLKICDLRQNELVLVDVDLPPSVSVLNLYDNRLEQIPSCVGGLSNLENLNLSSNMLREASCKFESKKLEYLNLECNEIEALCLVFHRVIYYGVPAINFQGNQEGVLGKIYLQNEDEMITLYTRGMIDLTAIHNPVTFTVEQLLRNLPEKRGIFVK